MYIIIIYLEAGPVEKHSNLFATHRWQTSCSQMAANGLIMIVSQTVGCAVDPFTSRLSHKRAVWQIPSLHDCLTNSGLCGRSLHFTIVSQTVGCVADPFTSRLSHKHCTVWQKTAKLRNDKTEAVRFMTNLFLSNCTNSPSNRK